MRFLADFGLLWRPWTLPPLRRSAIRGEKKNTQQLPQSVLPPHRRATATERKYTDFLNGEPSYNYVDFREDASARRGVVLRPDSHPGAPLPVESRCIAGVKWCIRIQTGPALLAQKGGGAEYP